MPINKYKRRRISKINVQDLPLEVILEIVRYLSESDINSLAAVNKIWRYYFLNQNNIWKPICEKHCIKENDYLGDSPPNLKNHLLPFKTSTDFNLHNVYGPRCKWWQLYIYYNRVLNNLRTNNISVNDISSNTFEWTYCNNDHIINIAETGKTEMLFLNESTSELERKKSIDTSVFRRFLLRIKRTPVYSNTIVQIKCNEKFLVIGICSVLFVHSFMSGNFVFQYACYFRDGEFVDLTKKPFPSEECLKKNLEPMFDVHDDRLVFLHPYTNYAVLINLSTRKKVTQDIVYSERKKCDLRCVKLTQTHLMIGVFILDNWGSDSQSGEHKAIVIKSYDRCPYTERVELTMHSDVDEFVENISFIGVRGNTCESSAFIDKSKLEGRTFTCWEFSLDFKGQYMYYILNHTLYQRRIGSTFDGDSDVSGANNFDDDDSRVLMRSLPTQGSYLEAINDRFLLAKLTSRNAYDIFDVKNCCIVNTINVPFEYSIQYLGTLRIMLTNDEKYKVIRFSK